jgi:3-oxoacyl-[acyl-carrier-protein] synthase II
MTTKRRVVVTGMGAVTPLGNDLKQTWRGLLEGKSGIGSLVHYDATGLACQIGGEVRDFKSDDWVVPREAPYMDRGLPFACAAAKEALDDSGLLMNGVERHRIGCNVSTLLGGGSILTRAHDIRRQKGARFVSPLSAPFTIANMVCSYISIQHGLTGPTHCIVSACATSTDAIGDALMLIQAGRADAVVTGGADNFNPTMLATFISARAVTLTHNDTPTLASRPFDRHRDGFVASEGAAVLILEEHGHAKARGAKVYGEILGYGAASDAHHLSSPHPDGEGAKMAMRMALEDAALSSDRMGYINAHATSTSKGDLVECKAIREVFGEKADQIYVSSTKSSIGHMLGAAGAIEAIFSLLALHEGLLPQTLNLHDREPECDLNFITDTPVKTQVDFALSNSFGFGGHCASLIFGR